MKLNQSLMLLAAAGVAILALASCSQATAETKKETVSTAKTNFVFDFESTDQLFTRGQEWDTAPVLEVGNGGKVMTVTGSWGNNYVSFSPTIDLTGKTQLKLDVKGNMSGTFRISLYEGTNEMQLDVAASAYNNTTFTNVALPFSAAANGAFAGSLAKIDKVTIFGMGLTGTASVDNITAQ